MLMESDVALTAVLVKNKIEYRKRLMTLIQATVRMWKVRREYQPRFVAINVPLQEINPLDVSSSVSLLSR